MDVDTIRRLTSYDPDTGLFHWAISRRGASKGSRAFHVDNGRYLQGTINGKAILTHRIAWAHFYGAFPEKNIDHINRDPKDNRIKNLREATLSQNGQNSGKKSNNTSGFKGVYWIPDRRKWLSKIIIDGTSRYLGIYDTPEAASAAYGSAAMKHFGEFYTP